LLILPKYHKSVEFGIPARDISMGVTLLGLFTKEECEKIIREASAMPNADKPGGTGSGTVDDYRRTKTCWLENPSQWNWVYNRIHSQINRHNKMTWQFQLSGVELIQFSQYPAADKGHYGWHDDCLGTRETQTRKLTCSIQLSDPRDYDGGELELFEDRKVSRIQGCGFVFPSFILHRVTPVERGTRCSLVAWTTGEPFK
jgi:PKHD-type hydroxylase